MLNIGTTKLLAFIPTSQLVMAGNIFSKGIKFLLTVSIAFGCIYALPSQANEKHRVIEIIETHLMESDRQNLLAFATGAILEDIALEEISISKPANEKNLKAWLDVSRFLHGLKDKSSKSNDQYMTQLADEWLCIIHSNLASKYNYGIKNALHICQSYFNQYVRKNGLDAVISMPVIEFVIDIFSLNNRHDEISEIVQLAEVNSDYLASMSEDNRLFIISNSSRMTDYFRARNKGFAILKQYAMILEINTEFLRASYHVREYDNDDPIYNDYCDHYGYEYGMEALVSIKNYELASIVLEYCINYMGKRRSVER
ncbi:hypothetical protein LQF76_00740 [Gloeomargaritales cyanobacterium VI4D9]|nr:hypothetical protein LQF76_00740 [Gloeomargaritales cyanobacterium VI4D9]